MKWDILILTKPERKEFLAQLRAILEPQIVNGTLGVAIRIVTDMHWSAGGPADLGAKREYMRRQSHADYVSFIDDDDLVAKDFVAKILPLLDGVDQVGFEVKVLIDWKPIGRTYHRLTSDHWYSDRFGHYRHISHINPMRRELALKVPMSGGVGEDFRWAQAMTPFVKTEHYIDEVLYFYISRNARRNDAIDWNDARRLALIDTLTKP